MFQHDLNHYPYSSISECSKIWHNLQRTKWKFQNKWYLVGESKTQSFYTLNSNRTGVFELQWNFHYHIWEIKSVHYGWFNNSILSSVLPYFLIEKTNQQLGTLQPGNSQKPTHTPQSEWKKKKRQLGPLLQAEFCLLSHSASQQGAAFTQPVVFLSAILVDIWEFGYTLTSRDNTPMSLYVLPLTDRAQLTQNLQELLLFFDTICWTSILTCLWSHYFIECFCLNKQIMVWNSQSVSPQEIPKPVIKFCFISNSLKPPLFLFPLLKIS